jgi:hypothetical protein
MRNSSRLVGVVDGALVYGVQTHSPFDRIKDWLLSVAMVLSM